MWACSHTCKIHHEQMWFMCERAFCSAESDTDCRVSWSEVSLEYFSAQLLQSVWDLLHFPHFKDGINLLHSAHLPSGLREWDTDAFHVPPTGVSEEAMDWTMSLTDDFRVTASIWRAGNYLGLFLLLSLCSLSVQSDTVSAKDHHFSWKTGKMFQYSLCSLPALYFNSNWIAQVKPLLWSKSIGYHNI